MGTGCLAGEFLSAVCCVSANISELIQATMLLGGGDVWLGNANTRGYGLIIGTVKVEIDSPFDIELASISQVCVTTMAIGIAPSYRTKQENSWTQRK